MPSLENIVEERQVAVQRIGQHEARHWMVARSLGFDVGPLELSLTGRGNEQPVAHKASSTIHLRRDLQSVDDIATYLRDRVQVLYAGALAQALTDGLIDEVIVKDAYEGNAKSDVDKAAEHLELLLNVERGADPSLLQPSARRDARNALCNELFQLAASRVQQHASHIMKIGMELGRRAAQNKVAVLDAGEIESVLAN
ncbi:hypothetical protein [Caballeronia sordidicola]|uniref:hypothetical protein n=1 Tax=Caballeronia sordidicola TaxID=196367 RepID=UPI0004D02E60|nr:hypothetical protein [Caballeronia sordidicola]